MWGEFREVGDTTPVRGSGDTIGGPFAVDTPSTVSSALHGAQAGLKELAQVTLKMNSKLREIEK